MSHTIKEKTKLLARVRRIKGQVAAIERALEEEIGCADVLMLVASVRGAVNGLTAELMEDLTGTSVDAPLCFTCGTKMRPSGSCYVCEGCGSTSGCS